MDRSPFLAQALQQMSVSPQPTGQGPDLMAMQRQVQQRQAWEAANPGQSYMGHQFGQMGQSLQQAPGAIMAAPGNMARGLGGLFGLGRAVQPSVSTPPIVAPR